MKLIKQTDCAEAIYEALRTPMLKGTFTDTMSLAMSLVKEVPTIEADPIKHGRWQHYEGTLTCSACHTEIYDDIMELLGDDVPRYCPNCGADMREVSDDN